MLGHRLLNICVMGGRLTHCHIAQDAKAEDDQVKTDWRLMIWVRLLRGLGKARCWPSCCLWCWNLIWNLCHSHADARRELEHQAGLIRPVSAAASMPGCKEPC